MANKYKVEFRQIETFVIDVLAKDETEAITLAENKFEKLEADGTIHYHNTGDGERQVGTVYDVTNTDDSWDGE